ncbi:phosphotriesterase family protein [Jeotgalibaca ciconiae]|uniref:Phosphotriesterase-related protein n=1 Tax=Jeotgalibaca ciconiae TaxID=2496265 RepID=A0A3Q9BL47_9LACT|nr:TatD family hydrolase [Jeotgalibaca ciconiae]AZP04781.1 phosphotriesterase-related protein [Jeotgalibaca ciconiae]HJB23864.1 TatD family hydrolase [Candidatus Jeotgalibaca pullicola]
MPLVDGITYAHEHTTIDLSSLKQTEDTNLNCFEETIQEYQKLYKKGVRNIIDVTVRGMKRNPEYVKRVAEASGINIIQSTGWYQDKFLPEYISEKTVEELAKMMIKDIEEGIDGSSIKAELIGEIGTSKNEMTDRERKVFEAAVLAQKQTGVPITTHTTLGTFGKEQVAFFKEQGANLSRIVIGHVDLTGDTEYVLDLLREGVYVEFDTVGKENYMSDRTRLEMLAAIEKEGYTDRVFLSMDITRRSHLEYRGGLGYSFLLDSFIPLLREGGITEQFIGKMLINNPKEFFQAKKEEIVQ